MQTSNIINGAHLGSSAALQTAGIIILLFCYRLLKKIVILVGGKSKTYKKYEQMAPDRFFASFGTPPTSGEGQPSQSSADSLQGNISEERAALLARASTGGRGPSSSGQMDYIEMSPLQLL